MLVVVPLQMLATHDEDGLSVVRPWGLIVGKEKLDIFYLLARKKVSSGEPGGWREAGGVY